ncbi:DNA topoisomerase 1 [Labeo rohita]|uniref:DNA topoisomerase 1 n=1 Tax=Labeo rohita TaxID=84645 RepID=A0ABQ8MFL6_LABRO|nr:DNA topoisomerase 1 [Labeo rohita]
MVIAIREHVRKILAHTPSHLNVTASAEQGSPVSAPTISQTSCSCRIHLMVILCLRVPQKCKSSHRRRHLSFKTCLEQHTLTLAEVKKDTNHLREVTVAGKILDFQPAISILENEEGIHYSHYILYDTTAKVHLSLAEKFIVTLNQWYIFKSLSICDFGKGNVLCSTELTTLEPFTPLADNLQESEETVISGKVTEALLTFEYICSCGAMLSLSNTKLFRIKCNKCRKSCRCENVQNRAKANVTIKQPNETYQRVVLNDALLHSIVSFKREGYCDSQQLEDRLLKAERMIVVCVDDEPRRVEIEAVEQTKDVAKKSFFSRWCVMM